ncbi:hypothetical protein DBR06_SOUSAS3410185, partial [Sousa chinensis]
LLKKIEVINDLEAKDFQIEDYNPHLTIKMETAI